MAKAEADSIMRRGFGAKGKKGSQEVITNESYRIPRRERNVGISHQQNQTIHPVMDGRRHCPDNSKTKELPEFVTPVRMPVYYLRYSLTYSAHHRKALLLRYKADDA
mgnify:CR=1 FL=1